MLALLKLLEAAVSSAGLCSIIFVKNKAVKGKRGK
jgi:hypothetical protein